MTDTLGNTYVPTTPSDTSTPSTREKATDEARDVAHDAAVGGKQTAETAKQQASEVADEAMTQARALVDQTKEQLTEQGATQQARAASGLHSLATELTGMTEREGSQHGIATDVVREASDRVRSAATWLESRQPADVVDDVRRFARQRPGTFLLSAAAIGFVGGRLARGIAADAKDDSAPVTEPVGTGTTLTAPVGVAQTSTTGAPTGTGTGFPVEGSEAPLR